MAFNTSGATLNTIDIVAAVKPALYACLKILVNLINSSVVKCNPSGFTPPSLDKLASSRAFCSDKAIDSFPSLSLTLSLNNFRVSS